MSLNLAAPLRTAILGAPAIVAKLGSWESEPSVHTRRPVPEGANYPMVVVGPDVAIVNADFLNTRKPIVIRDVTVYGQNPKHYRDVEEVAYLLRDLFHEERFAITVAGYHVVNIEATGPIPGPTDDEKHLARAVTLAVHLQRLAA